MKQCWLPDKDARPTTDQLLEKLNTLKEHYKQNAAQWDQICAKRQVTNNNSNSSNDLKAVELKMSAELPVKENGPNEKK
jgi:hypothetical protein